ncbi:MAG: carboxypeptidase regulatory-like domain-containing protein [Planctomycetes bacterium]|nr:carboxypeptidase regulatory-like domain-containing protein [Planctomycetota bacterium]
MKNLYMPVVLIVVGIGAFVALLVTQIAPFAQNAGNSAAQYGNQYAEERVPSKQPESWSPEAKPEEPERAATLRVVYADGKPYDKGQVSVSCDGWYRDAESPQRNTSSEFLSSEPDLTRKITTVLLALDGTLPLQGMPEDTPVRIYLRSQRLEYAHYSETLPPEKFDGVAEVVITLQPTAPGQGRYLYNLQVPEGVGDETTVRLLAGDHRAECEKLRLGEALKTKVQHEDSGPMCLLVTGPDTAYFKQLPEVPGPGEHELVIEQYTPGSLQVKIVDKSNSPIPGATIEYLTASFPSFPAEKTAYLVAVADSDGVALLEGQPAGFGRFRVEAKGKQFEEVQADVVAGEVTDLGTVTMTEPIGSLRIACLDALPAGESFSYQIYNGFCRGGDTLGEVEGSVGDHTFEKLVVGRSYGIWIDSRRDGERVAYLSYGVVMLTHAQPTLEVTFSLSDLRKELNDD